MKVQREILSTNIFCAPSFSIDLSAKNQVISEEDEENLVVYVTRKNITLKI